MLPKDKTHPRQGNRRRDGAAAFLLFIGGAAFLVFSIALAGATAAKELKIFGQTGEATWNAALMSFFYVLCASECFTTNITKYAGDVLRSLAERFSGKADRPVS